MQAAILSSPPLRHPRFDVLSKRGAGGFGTVYEVFDRERGFTVALKLLHRVGPKALEKFRAEFRALSELRHPNLPTLFDLFLHEDRWFFTMDLVNGSRLADHVSLEPCARADGEAKSLPHTEVSAPSGIHDPSGTVTEQPRVCAPPVDYAKLRSAVAQLTDALNYIHGTGRVHCDVKPSNVLVEPSGRLVLLDFGLAQSFGARITFEGTPGYAAPEQILHEHVGPPADYYALGTMLFETLAGRRPFVGPESQVLLDKVQFDPPALRRFTPDAPDDIVMTCMTWLSRAPAERLTHRSPTAVATAPTDRFIGRVEDLERLRMAYATARRHQHIVVIEGASGIGKSALIRRFLTELNSGSEKPLVLSGKARDREHVAFNAFDGIADALKEHATNARLKHILHDLAALFPSLRTQDANAGIPATRENGFDALTRALDSTDGAPPILWLDDTQWADLDSQALLRAICTAPSPPRCLILLTKRPGPSVLDIPVRSEHWELAPLSPKDAEALASVLVPAEVKGNVDVARIAAASAGLPLFIEELSRAPSRGQLPQSVDQSIIARADSLSPTVRRVLHVVCLSGAALRESDIAVAAKVSREECSRILEHLRYERLVSPEQMGMSRDYRPYHDRVRDVVVETLEAPVRATLHARIADALEQDPLAPPALLANHLVHAGDLERAASVVLVAAGSAESVFAYDQAARLYEQALVLDLPVGLPRRTLMEKRANALEKAHLSADAAAEYLSLSDCATDERERVAYLERACRLFLWSGELERGMAALDALFQRLGERLPNNQVAALSELAWHYLGPHRSDRVGDTDERRFLILRSAAQGLGMIDNLRGALLHARAFRMGHSFADRERSAEALALEAIFSGCSGELGRQRARSLVRKLDALFAPSPLPPRALAWRSAALAVTEMQRAPTFEAATRLKECEDRFLELRDGDAWAISSLRLIRALTLRIVGDLPTLRTFVPEILRDAERRHDRYAYSTIGRGAVILWKADDAPDFGHSELKRLTWPRLPGSFHFQEWVGLEARGELALYEGTVRAFVEDHRAELWALRMAPFNVLVQSVRVLVLTLLGKLELARYERGERACRWSAHYYAKRLFMEGVEYATIRGELLAAGLCAVDRRFEKSATHLGRAAAIAEAANYPYLGGVSSFLLGKLSAHGTPCSPRLSGFLPESLARMGVMRPDLVSRSEAPGFALLM